MTGKNPPCMVVRTADGQWTQTNATTWEVGEVGELILRADFEHPYRLIAVYAPGAWIEMLTTDPLSGGALQVPSFGRDDD